jgi:hypothetical protein
LIFIKYEFYKFLFKNEFFIKNKIKGNKMSLTGVRDTDILILMQLEDHELGPVCQVNSYVRSLCKDPNFWYKRIIEKNYKSMEAIKKFNKRIIKLIPNINGIQIEKIREFFGFKNLQQLSEFLNKFSIYAIAMINANYDHIDITVNQIYNFDENKLPEYLDKNELIFFLRREITKNVYENIEGRLIKIPKLYLSKKTPGYTIFLTGDYISLTERDYKIFKENGVRK